MGGQGDHVSTFDDWAAPSPSPRTFFSSILADDMNTTSILENNNELFPGLSEDNLNGNKGDTTSGLVEGESRSADIYSQQKMNSRGGLVERMAARTGFDAPKLNTGGVRPTGFSQNKDARSPYLTIPPGLSPTTLLESPVFLSNSFAQPSPTTGKFPFTFGGFDARGFSSNQEGLDKNRENIYGNINTSSFAFKPVPESGTSSFLGPMSNNFPGFEVSKGLVVSSENSSPLENEQNEEGEQPSGGDPPPGITAPAEDGFNWRKYGQKQVKGSEFPRSYYKCTHPNCPVKKKVERSQEGHITEIIYKGAHSHPKPAPNRRSGATMLSDAQDNSLEVTSSESVEAENLLKSEDVVDDGEEDDRVTHGSVSLGCEGEEDESESKRRKVEAYTAADMSGATRAIREPRVVVQTTSEVDILDDGYRWRKYGQKVVKGNPNPRSYYKCTQTGCAVRKHVERASHDLKSVITTYEGKHNHEVPAARNTTNHHTNAPNVHTNHHTNAPNVPTHLPAHFQRHDSAQLQNAMARFDNRNNLVIGPYGQQQQLGPSHGLGYGMGQPAFVNMAMAGMGPDRSINTYMEQQPNYNEMGFMLPKGEPKVEPFAEAPMNLHNGSSGYHQM